MYNKFGSELFTNPKFKNIIEKEIKNIDRCTEELIELSQRAD